MADDVHTSALVPDIKPEDIKIEIEDGVGLHGHSLAFTLTPVTFPPIEIEKREQCIIKSYFSPSQKRKTVFEVNNEGGGYSPQVPSTDSNFIQQMRKKWSNASVTQALTTHADRPLVCSNSQQSSVNGRDVAKCKGKSLCDGVTHEKFSTSSENEQNDSCPSFIADDTEETFFTCDSCNKSFTKKSTLRFHMREHTVRLSCTSEVRDFNFKPKPSFKGDTPCRPFICKVCGKSFKYKHLFKYHSAIHTTERPYVCKVCDRTFKRTTDLNLHMVRHSMLGQFLCDICGTSYRLKSEIDHHMLEHSGGGPFPCKHCKQPFRSTESLNRHIGNHSKVCPYVCGICNSSFGCITLLVRHSNEAH